MDKEKKIAEIREGLTFVVGEQSAEKWMGRCRFLLSELERLEREYAEERAAHNAHVAQLCRAEEDNRKRFVKIAELVSERERMTKENRKLREERDDAREQAQKYYRKFEDEVAEIFQLQDELQSAQQEIKRLEQERDKLIEVLRWYGKTSRYSFRRNGSVDVLADSGQRARNALKEIGVRVE